jgi:hypothetical protein
MQKGIKKGEQYRRKESVTMSTQTIKDAFYNTNAVNKKSQLLLGDNFMKKFENTQVNIGFGGARKHLTQRT